MTKMAAADKELRAYVRLSALKKNLPNVVSETYVSEYHAILDVLADQGYNLEEFRVTEDELYRRFVSGNFLTGETRYSQAKYVQRAFFLSKLDAVLEYLKASGSGDSRLL